jgi:amino acid transporter
MEENNITSQGEVNQTPESLLRVSPKMKESLLSSMNWIQFFVILCCFAVVILTIIAIVMLAISSFFPVENPDMSPLVMLCMGLLYLVVGVVYVYPIVKGFKLIDHTRKALRAGTNSDFEASADDLHSIMKYCGWLTIISFVLYIIFMIAIVLFAAMSPSFLS